MKLWKPLVGKCFECVREPTNNGNYNGGNFQITAAITTLKLLVDNNPIAHGFIVGNPRRKGRGSSKGGVLWKREASKQACIKVVPL